mgnify:CR=1
KPILARYHPWLDLRIFISLPIDCRNMNFNIIAARTYDMDAKNASTKGSVSAYLEINDHSFEIGLAHNGFVCA